MSHRTYKQTQQIKTSIEEAKEEAGLRKCVNFLPETKVVSEIYKPSGCCIKAVSEECAGNYRAFDLSEGNAIMPRFPFSLSGNARMWRSLRTGILAGFAFRIAESVLQCWSRVDLRAE